MTLDITDTLAANSNQMNAADIMGVEPIVRIENVSRNNDPKQPLVVYITGGFKPFLPCKTVRRILAQAWGADAGTWIGKWMKLYREPTVVYANEEVGGIRVKALSDFPGGTVSVKERKTGKPAVYRIEKLTPPKEEPMDLATFRATIGHALKNGWSREQIVAVVGAEKADDVPAEKRAEIARALREAAPVVDGGAK
jgi:hypothetical protein